MAQLHVQLSTLSGDAQILVPHPAHQVEGLARRPLQRQLPGVVRHVSFHGLAQVWRREEETIRRHLSADGLARALEVVPVDKQLHPADTVIEVDEDRPGQVLLPERLPPPFQLPHRHRVLRPALDVHDPQRTQLLLKLRLPPPRRVLTPLVREDLPRTSVGRHRTAQCLHHERALLVVRNHVADHVARVVVHKRHHVEPLVLAKKKREDIAHPHLIRPRALESSRRMLPRRHRCLPLDQSFLVQDPAYMRLADPQCLEARQHVTDPPRPVLRVLALDLEHRLLLLKCRSGTLLRAAPLSLLRHQRRRSSLLVLRDP